jgi:hypothetical protein
MKRIDLTGKRFGRLVVISYSHSHIQPSKQKRAMWNVICDCGNEKKVSTSCLKNKTTSCGCYLNEIRTKGLNKKPKGEANFNYKYLSYKTRAKNHKKKIKFLLSKNEFRRIILMNCHYCNSKPVYAHTHRSYNGEFLSNGIDRINSAIGYTIENCVPCCPRCNLMKNNLSYEDFINHIKRIIYHASFKAR